MPAIVRAEINLTALLHNVQIIKQHAPQAKLLAMIKANAYGHGASEIAKALAPVVDGLGVARLAEAVRLHDIGIRSPIFVMDGFFSAAELQETMRDHFIPVLNNTTQIALLEQTEFPYPINAWVKINTGMNRLGFAYNDIPAIYQRLLQCKNILQPIGLMTHFACADEASHPMNQMQTDLFWQTVQHYPGEKSLTNSAGILNFPQNHADWVRPGLMLYGCSPLPQSTGSDLNLKPVMTLKSELIAINEVKKGNRIGYGATYTCEEDTRIGVVAIGYGDGYPRHIQPHTPVLIQGSYAPITGRVSMDMLTVNLNNHPNAQIGEEVILWGEGLSVELIAHNAGTLSYELLCQVNQTPERVAYYWSESNG